LCKCGDAQDAPTCSPSFGSCDTNNHCNTNSNSTP
jgi:hypothetical protein